MQGRVQNFDTADIRQDDGRCRMQTGRYSDTEFIRQAVHSECSASVHWAEPTKVFQPLITCPCLWWYTILAWLAAIKNDRRHARDRPDTMGLTRSQACPRIIRKLALIELGTGCQQSPLRSTTSAACIADTASIRSIGASVCCARHLCASSWRQCCRWRQRH